MIYCVNISKCNDVLYKSFLEEVEKNLSVMRPWLSFGGKKKQTTVEYKNRKKQVLTSYNLHYPSAMTAVLYLLLFN